MGMARTDWKDRRTPAQVRDAELRRHDATVSGHLDKFGGNAKVELQVLPSAALPEPEWVTKALDPPAESPPAGSGG